MWWGVDRTDGQAEAMERGEDPVAVALDEVVVDGDDVALHALEAGQEAGHRGDDRLALTGAHLGDGAGVEHEGADELHVERATAERRAALGEDLAHGLVDADGDVDLHVARDGRLAAEHGLGLEVVDLRLQLFDLLTDVGREPVEGELPVELRVEDVADAHVAVERLAHDGERLELELIDGALAGLDGVAHLDDALAELLVGHLDDLRFEGGDLADALAEGLDEAVVAGAEDLGQALGDGFHRHDALSIEILADRWL